MADREFEEFHVGDKFVIEVAEVEWHPIKGNRYFIKGFDSLMFTDYGISRLEKYKEPPKARPHSCEFCKYMDRASDEMPCALCDKNDYEPRDMFEDKGI